MPRLVVRWYPAVLVLLAAAASLAVLDRLPESMPIHFTMDGTANGWAPRDVGAFIAPALMLLLWGVLRVAPTIDPRRENYAKFGSAYETTVAATLVLLLVVHLFVLALALGHHVPMQRLLPSLLGALFVVIGNVLPRARSNFMYGIRTPWTLSSERVWTRTHRLGGYTMTIAGLSMLAAGAFFPAAFTTPALVITVALAVVTPAVYSYVAWRQETQS
ncbi:MAG: SdpI family protein [Gemmatimonadaceae bacterium]